jgi:peptidoglycan-associated lipoprotein
MKIAQTIALLSLAACPLLVVACGGDKPADPKTPADNKPATAQTTATPTATTAATVEKDKDPKASNVHIDKEILKACGIPEPEAFFALDSSNLRKQDLAPLDKVATCFTTGPLKVRGLRIVGHADPRGGSEYNMMLGQARADAVKEYLVGKGMDKAKADSTTRGAMDAQGHDEASYAKDRRPFDAVTTP